MCSRCAPCVPGVRGHVGYELRPPTTLAELYPTHCPAGHRARPGRVSRGWDGATRVVHCWDCSDRGLPSDVRLCLCRGDKYAHHGRTAPTPVEVDYPLPDAT